MASSDDGFFRVRMNDTSLPDLFTATEKTLLHFKFGVAEPWHWFSESADVIALAHCQHTGRLFCAHRDGWITVRSLHVATVEGGDEETRFSRQGNQAVRSLALSANGSRLFSAGWDCSCVVWDTATAEAIMRLEHHTDRVNVVVCNLAGDRCFSAGQDGVILQYQISSHSSTPSVRTLWHHKRAVRALALSNDDVTLFSSGWEGQVCVWQDGALQRTMQVHTSAVNALSWSATYPDRIFSCSNDGTVQVWDWKQAACIRVLDIGAGAIKCVICRAELLFWGGADGALYQVNVDEDGIEEPMVYKCNKFVGGVTALCFVGAVQLEPVVLRGMPGTGNST